MNEPLTKEIAQEIRNNIIADIEPYCVTEDRIEELQKRLQHGYTHVVGELLIEFYKGERS